MKNALKDFVAQVEHQEDSPGPVVEVEKETAVATKDFVQKRLKASAKGGANSRRRMKVSSDPKLVRHRERMRRYRRKRRNGE